jgi:hypothetical protein
MSNTYFHQPSGTTNRLTRPIAIIGSRSAYMHLCLHANLDPNNNDVFEFVQFVWDTEDKEYSRVLTIQGAENMHDRRRIVSAARGRILNDRK